MISADLLRCIRNDLPMPVTIARWARGGPPPNERGYFHLLWPHCRENCCQHRSIREQPRPLLCCKQNSTTSTCSSPSDYDFRAAVTLSNAGSTSTRPKQAKRKTPPPLF